MAIVHENGIPELVENGLLVRDSKREESEGCERRRINQTSGEGFSKHGSQKRAPRRMASQLIKRAEQKAKENKTRKSSNYSGCWNFPFTEPKDCSNPTKRAILTKNNPKT